MRRVILNLISVLFLINHALSQGEEKNVNVIDYANRFKEHYSLYFQVKQGDGKVLKITDDDPIGLYFLKSFSTVLPQGRICWFNNVPHGVSKSALGQCYLAKPGIIEIRLNKQFNEGVLDLESFWKTLVFELCNAGRAGSFLELMDQLSEDQITRKQYAISSMKLEFLSACEAQKFQKDVWRPFCKKNQLSHSDFDWFFPSGIKFEEWLQMLSSTKEGRDYLEVYFGSSK